MIIFKKTLMFYRFCLLPPSSFCSLICLGIPGACMSPGTIGQDHSEALLSGGAQASFGPDDMWLGHTSEPGRGGLGPVPICKSMRTAPQKAAPTLSLHLINECLFPSLTSHTRLCQSLKRKPDKAETLISSSITVSQTPNKT